MPGRPKVEEVRRLLEALDQPIAISMLTVHLVLHFGRVEHVSDELIHAAIARCEVLDLSEPDYAWAKTHETGKDFEDALQLSVALRAGCTHFMTLDHQLAKNYHQQPFVFIAP